MRPIRFLVDDDAVSPVIGIILMVAITTILAAVAGVFVLGFETGKQPAPTAAFTAEPGQQAIITDTGPPPEFKSVQTVTLRHQSGEALDPALLSVTVDRKPAFGVDTSTPGVDESESGDTASRLYDDDSADITAGDKAVVVAKYDTSASGSPADAVGEEYTTSGGEFTVDGSSSVEELQTGEIVRIRWISRDEERSAVLFEHRIGSS
jgi:FlaG/FlaF family flagellin (archaellin)